MEEIKNTPELDVNRLAAHFHDTGGRAIENLLIAIKYGINVVDSSVGGLGGCPYADGATGNVSTEHVLEMCKLLDIHTGINLE